MRLIFVPAQAYKNNLTLKISQFTVDVFHFNFITISEFLFLSTTDELCEYFVGEVV